MKVNDTGAIVISGVSTIGQLKDMELKKLYKIDEFPSPNLYLSGNFAFQFDGNLLISLLNNTLDSLFLGEYRLEDGSFKFSDVKFVQNLKKFDDILIFPTFSNKFLFSNKYESCINLIDRQETGLFSLMKETYGCTSINLFDVKKANNQLHVIYSIDENFYYCCWNIRDDGEYILMQNQIIKTTDKAQEMKSRLFFTEDLDILYIQKNTIRTLKRIPLNLNKGVINVF